MDKQRCLQEEGNELSIIPQNLLKVFRAELTNITIQTTTTTTSRNQKSIPKDNTKTNNQLNINLCMTFLKFFVNTIGSYRKYLYPSEDCLHAGDQFEFNVIL